MDQEIPNPPQSVQAIPQESLPPTPSVQLKKPVNPLVFISLGVLILAAGAGVYYLATKTTKPASVACTMEAKICPDGSSVGRTGPNCEFAPCLTTSPNPVASWKTYTYEKYGFSFKYPSEYVVEERDPGFLIVVDPTDRQIAQAGISIDSRLMGPYASYASAKNVITTANTITETKTVGNWEIFQGTGKDGMLQGVAFRFGIASYKTGAIETETLANTKYVSIFDQILSTFKFLNPAQTVTNTKKIAYIKSITPNYDTYQLQVDYIDYVQDSTTPNGFRIDNPSTELANLPIEQNPLVILQTYSHTKDGNFNYNQSVSLSEFLNAFNSGSAIKEVPYWLEIQNGTVIKITEQYIP